MLLKIFKIKKLKRTFLYDNKKSNSFYKKLDLSAFLIQNKKKTLKKI